MKAKNINGAKSANKWVWSNSALYGKGKKYECEDEIGEYSYCHSIEDFR
jgi:hypothetical protein